MSGELISRANLSVPRYTSYPTAPHFKGSIDSSRYESWLQEQDPAQPVSLYLHVPFCKKMCWYCGCHTKIAARYSPVETYAKTLRAEIEMLADRLPGRFSLSHLHWGGGTPTILSEEDFKATMALIGERFHFTSDAERAIEIDPRTVDAAKITALAAAGINRASLGVQDFSPAVQKAINRVQSFEITRNTTENLRRAGIEKINFDLMYGLPLQTEADILRTVDLSHQLRPDRIALFGYAHVPWMKSHMRLINDDDLPGAELRLSQAAAAATRLKQLGYRQIGLDHFARSDDTLATAQEKRQLHRNFQGYTTDMAQTLLGVGASAIGQLPQGYVQNAVSIHEYEKSVAKSQLPVIKGIETGPDDILRRYVIERLMCDLEVDLKEVCEKFGCEPTYFKTERAALQEYEDEGLVKLQDETITITHQGRFFVRTICALFDKYLEQGLARHSKAV